VSSNRPAPAKLLVSSTPVPSPTREKPVLTISPPYRPRVPLTRREWDRQWKLQCCGDCVAVQDCPCTLCQAFVIYNGIRPGPDLQSPRDVVRGQGHGLSSNTPKVTIKSQIIRKGSGLSKLSKGTSILMGGVKKGVPLAKNGDLVRLSRNPESDVFL